MKIITSRATSMTLFLKSKSTKKLAGLDIGTRHVGFALSDEDKKFVTPITTLSRNQPRMTPESISNFSNQLDNLIVANRVEAIIIGLPILNKKLTPFCEEIIEFMSKVEVSDPSVACLFWNEEYSTHEARNLFANISSKKSIFKKQRDGLAAAVILSNYLKFHHTITNNNNSSSSS